MAGDLTALLNRALLNLLRQRLGSGLDVPTVRGKRLFRSGDNGVHMCRGALGSQHLPQSISRCIQLRTAGLTRGVLDFMHNGMLDAFADGIRHAYSEAQNLLRQGGVAN